MHTFGHYIKMLSCGTGQAMSNALADVDLTAAQGHVMGYIFHAKQPPCARDIEEAFHLSHPTVSGILARLEKKDFIEFRPDALDRRCKRIYVLEKGTQLHETMQSVIQQTDANLTRGFTPEEQELFAQFLLRAINNVAHEKPQGGIERK